MASKLDFEEVDFELEKESVKTRVFLATKNGRSPCLKGVDKMDVDRQDDFWSILLGLATIPGFNSNKIKYLSRYKLWQLRVGDHHRFFFFRIKNCCIIFFDHLIKKKNSLDPSVYRDIQERMELYEKKFRERS